MKLSYRGVSYEDELSILEANEGEIGGKYRGQNWRYRYPKHIPHLEPKLYMQYRGVPYSTHPIPKTEGTPIPQSKATRNFCTVPIRKQCKVVAQETAKIHLENICRNLERRLQVAKASGDENLVNLLENESKQLALNI
ncbi:MAG: DUF4278 domain-containing protein [Xenococcaceae cyanobacterium]